MAATARISIALPLDLKSRMNAASASNIIRPNWSALLRPRIEAELANLERQRGDQAAAIARLRASRLENEQYDLIDGTAHGRAWAEQRADYRALKRLARGAHQYKNAWDHPWEWLCKALDPQGRFTDEELGAHLFADECSDRLEYGTYLRAFIEGAIEAWKELAPHVITCRNWDPSWLLQRPRRQRSNQQQSKQNCRRARRRGVTAAGVPSKRLLARPRPQGWCTPTIGTKSRNSISPIHSRRVERGVSATAIPQ